MAAERTCRGPRSARPSTLPLRGTGWPITPAVSVERISTRTSFAAAAGVTAGIAAAYCVAAQLGLSIGVVRQVTTVWPPTGIALAATLLLGARRAWLGIALGALVANKLAGEPIPTAIGVAVGNTLEAVTGAWLLREIGFRLGLDRLRDVLALMIAASLATMVSATIGVVSLCLGGVQPWASAPVLWGVWWLGDTIGALVAAPVLLVWLTPSSLPLPASRRGEATALVAATLAASAVFFTGRSAIRFTGYPLHYAVFPLVIWAALRFGQRGTASVTLITSALAILGTVHGSGPFTFPTVHESLLMLQLFMAVVAATGLLLGAAITERDVARRRATADYERLQASEERLRLALDAGRMGVWDWNIATGDVTWTESLEPLHGLAPGTFPGTIESFRALVHPEDRDAVDRAIGKAVDEGTGYDVEFRNVRPDGDVGWIAGKGRVFRDASGRPVRMIGVGMDVTDRRRLADELAARVRDLAEADRRKDEFLAMLAHELRNPLSPLGTALHIVRTDADRRERFLDMADRQVRQLIRLVDDLLDVSRITQGKITLRREPTLLDEVVARALETVRPLIDTRGHALTVTLPPHPVRLDADPTRLAQVLGNLLANATKFTPAHGSIWLTAETMNGEVAVRVRDTGAGLAPELLPHVFDIFVQGDRSLDRARGGLGIGLTIVRQLVELHGGRVKAWSDGIGKGSEFTFHLPIARAVEGPRPARPAADDHAARPLRILVVEDNEDTAESLTTILEVWGHEVRVALDGLAALEIAASWQPEVVLSDLGLPGMDGYALARRLRQIPALGRAVLIALSGYGRDQDRRQAFDAGFDHHLVKPPDLEGLAALLARIAGARTPAAEARSVERANPAR